MTFVISNKYLYQEQLRGYGLAVHPNYVLEKIVEPLNLGERITRDTMSFD